MSVFRSFNKQSLLVCFACAAVLLVVGSTSGAPQITNINSNVGATPLFDGAIDQWDMPGAEAYDGSAFGPGFPRLNLSPKSMTTGSGLLSWPGNPLVLDQSGPPLNPPGLADGVFGPGGVFTLSGYCYDLGGNLLASGVLFQGTVGGFNFRETGANQNNMEINGVAVITPNAGYLFDQGYLMPQYRLSFQAPQCNQDLADVVDFTGNIMTTTSMQFLLVGEVPEPGSLTILGLGCLMLVSRRRVRQ